LTREIVSQSVVNGREFVRRTREKRLSAGRRGQASKHRTSFAPRVIALAGLIGEQPNGVDRRL
jgi:hypothetical protein